jgi:UDP-N-acetylglucosamine--N-acetylmuramyl-(pentapeptide) pyrophosphoryl-undecaprenol N-acetylglucosamine transferase
MKILLAGGGSGGPVSPLLAVQSYIKAQHPSAKFLFVGTSGGPERAMVSIHDPSIQFKTVPAGKVRRYFSWSNFAAPFQVLAGILKSLYVLAKFKPDVVLGAGGYVSVPVGIAAWILKRKLVIHQQDVEPTMSNQILAPLASKITVSLAASAKDFSREVVVTGNPFRPEILTAKPNRLALSNALPLVLVTGGGTGAAALNQVVAASLPELAKFCCVVHVTGRGKLGAPAHENYASREFVENMPSLLAAADIVVSRAGMATITELGALGKASIVVPMPGSHQEANALALDHAHAAIVLHQAGLTPQLFTSAVKNLLDNSNLRGELSKNILKITPRDSTAAVSQVILSLCSQ